MTTKCEVQAHAAFDRIRYAQCWEDADVLVAALQGPPGRRFASIASAGDNSLALLTLDPARVIAVDLNPAQLHCLSLRIAAYRSLNHSELLALIGARPHDERLALYQRCRDTLPESSRHWWDAQPELIRPGIGCSGRFEHYFALFRRYMLPLVHGPRRIESLMQPRDHRQRQRFYREQWDNWRWRLIFRLFFSRFVMGRLGRDPAFFRHVDGAVAERIRARTEHALTELDPAENPYLHWILTGRYRDHLPLALRPEHFDTIRARLDRLELRSASAEAALEDGENIDGYNLSDIFEYMSEAHSAQLIERLAGQLNPGGRLVYWNMLAPRSRPVHLAHRLIPEWSLATRLHATDKAFFYQRLIVETRQ